MAESVGLGAPITPTTAIEHRVQPDAVITPTQSRGEQAQPAVEQEPTKLGLGSVVAAVVRAPAAQGPAAGSQLLLRIFASSTAAPDLISGTIVDSIRNETLLATPIGLLALQAKLALPTGATIAFAVIDTVAPTAEPTRAPARSGGWIALEEALLALTVQAPALAGQLRSELTPLSGSALAGTLLYLLGAIYHGNWPGRTIGNALAQLDQGKLANRLGEDVAALRRLSDDAATGDWRVITLPVLLGNFPLALRLYLQRRKPPEQDGIRFALEAELSRLGPVQLDCLVRGTRLILVLRSHRALSPELREEMRAVFRDALQATGLAGDLSFATAASFLISPLDPMRQHIKITA